MDNDGEDTKFYTTQEHSQFQDLNGFFRSSDENQHVFAKAIKDKPSKNIVSSRKNYSYYIKASPNKILYDARKLHITEKSPQNHSYINAICKSNQTFLQVSEDIFNKYINFLKTGNVQWLNQAQREVK